MAPKGEGSYHKPYWTIMFPQQKGVLYSVPSTCLLLVMEEVVLVVYISISFFGMSVFVSI